MNEGDDEDNGVGAVIYAGAASAGALFILAGAITIILLWRRRKASGHGND